MVRYDFVENQDFVTFSEFSEKGRPRLEYALTLDKTSLLGLRTVLSGTSLWKTKIISRFLKKEAEKSMTYDNWQGRIEYFEKAIDKFKSILEND